ncbi:MAG: ZIP family metal transporter [Nitrosospira sp.]|nr:ZIP family metal transporter [Nitrosospira sp.]MDW7643152.1 ZIP family metal transporter [Nitrosomonadaceae bacterium]MDW7652818.1 ZIP family metal transporter [Nitrosomonadaceae bacterium]MDW7663952.1 ZIP family metal transporter [Nitrosomonadaceae bacterium]MDW7664708.1 ZIP family metal transporter [Nitrosomonadaceae bacterium]
MPTTLSWIISASLLGGLLSVLLAAALTLNTRVSWIQMLVSYAIGALLGATFFNTLPEALELSKNPGQISATVLFGILLFFILEKLLLWHHCHLEKCEAHHSLQDIPRTVSTVNDFNNNRSGMMVVLGDTFHNFVDGILIAAAFMTDIQLGIVTSFAIIAHEIPQEASNFIILLNSGYTRQKALLLNLLSSTATLIGSILTYLMLQNMNHLMPSLLALVASSMLYVAMADLIPHLHKRPQIDATVQQVALILLGIGSIWLTGNFFSHSI